MSSIQACGSSTCRVVFWLTISIASYRIATGAAQSEVDDSFPEQLFVTGTVVRDDGSSPPFGVAIERDCGNGYKKEVDAEVSGLFYFQITRRPSSTGLPANLRPNQSMLDMVMDKRLQPPPADVNLCVLRARLPGFRSSLVRVSGDPGSARVDVGKIVLYPDKKAKGAVVNLSGLKTPKEARKAMERAQSAMQKGDLDTASAQLRIAVEIYPQFSEAWYRLGFVDDRRQRYREAEESFKKAIAIDSNYLPPYLGLATTAWHRQDWAQMMDWSGRCLKIDAQNFPEAYFLNSMALYRMNMLDEAEETARKGQQADGMHRFTGIHLLLAEILFSKKDISGSMQEMRSYLRFAPQARDAESVRRVLKAREESVQSSYSGRQ